MPKSTLVGNAIVVWRKCPCNILPKEKNKKKTSQQRRLGVEMFSEQSLTSSAAAAVLVHHTP
jgi:uncharacterized protein with WD repeat